jgi:tight adherence protein B
MAQLPLVPTILSSACVFFAMFLGYQWMGSVWDQIASRRVALMIPRLCALGIEDSSISWYLRWWGILLVTTFVLFGILLGMFPVALGLVYLVYVAPTFVLDHFIRQRSQILRDQMVRAASCLANSARAGLSLPQGLEKVGNEVQQPMAGIIRRIVHEYKSGRPLTESLDEVSRRLDFEAFTMFSSTITVCLERGGKVTYALDRISETLHEVQRVERKLETDSASGRKLSLCLGMCPLGFLLLFTMLDGEFMGNLYHTFMGQCVLLLVGVMIYFAVRWCMKILDVDI